MMLKPLFENRFIDGRKVKERILKQVSNYVKQHSKKNNLGRLVSVSIGDTPEVDVYIRNQKKAAEKVGIRFEICKLEATKKVHKILQDEIKNYIHSIQILFN